MRMKKVMSAAELVKFLKSLTPAQRKKVEGMMK